MNGGSLQTGMKQLTEDFYYDENSFLGKGNFGTVYKGYHFSASQIIAVKFVDRKTLIKFPDHEREIVVMNDLAKINHPHIMGYYGYEKNTDGLYCFVEYCNGGSLKQLIQSKISELKALSLLEQLLDAMTYVNSENKIHRDLKPENILLDQDGELKIADFGLARDIEITMTKGMGTPLYAAPEVLNLTQYNEKCDVWSAGLIVYEMLMGCELFKHIKKKAELLEEIQLFANDPNRVKIKQQLHPQWSKIVNTMMTFNPKKRPTFKEMKAYFSKIKDGMRSDLLSKYGEEGAIQEDQWSLTRSINPYISKIGEKKNDLTDLASKLEEEKQFTNLNNVRKWLYFVRQKSEFMPKLIKQFNSNAYSCIKNVHKYILMFLSVAIYISRTEDMVTQIKDKVIKTHDGTISSASFKKNKVEFEKLLKEIEEKNEISLQKYKAVLTKQIIPKILNTYLQRPEEKKIITEINKLVELLSEGQQKKYREDTIYKTIFNKIVKSQGVHFSIGILKEFKFEDLKIYCYIILINRLDEVFPNTNYRNDDYLRAKKQEIANSTKQELLFRINKLN